MARFFTLVLLFLGAGSLSPIAAQTERHIIESIIIHLEGTTKEKAVRRHLSIREGMEFSSYRELSDSVDSARRSLENTKYFKSVEFHTRVTADSDRGSLYTVTFLIKDAWTIIPFVYPKFDSNTGIRLGGQIYWNNFIGTMTNGFLGFNMDFRESYEKAGAWGVRQWTINPRFSNIKLGSLHLTLNLRHQFKEERYVNEDIDQSKHYYYSYHTTSVDVGTAIPLTAKISYNFGTNFAFHYGYKDIMKNENFRKEPFTLSWNHGFGYGQVLREKQFRRGFYTSLNHNITLVSDYLSGKNFLVNTLKASVSFFLPFGKIFNYYAKINGTYRWNGRFSGAGSAIRGVRNDSMSGHAGIFMNNSVAITFWRWDDLWEAQIHPFFDIGFMADREREFHFTKELRYGAGMDFVLHLDAVPNLVPRISIGLDLSRHEWSDPRKFSISIDTSLFY